VSNSALGFSGLSSRPIVVTVGTSSCRISSCLAGNKLDRLVIPVRFPPGRLRLATKPNLHRVGSDQEDNRDRCSRILQRERRCRSTHAQDHSRLTSNDFGCEDAAHLRAELVSRAGPSTARNRCQRSPQGTKPLRGGLKSRLAITSQPFGCTGSVLLPEDPASPSSAPRNSPASMKPKRRFAFTIAI
jgi:hypothetical protein